MASVIDGCDDLIEIIGTMLEIAKTDSGNFDFDPVSLDLIELVEDAVDLFMPVAEDKRIDIRLNKPSMAAQVTGDRRRLQRVVSNILDNAVKYTPHGGIITVTIKSDEGDVRVSISDTGIGISESDLPHIFERFFRSDKSRSTSGNGLGLSLAMAIIRAHGGDITVTSSDQGATFTFLLPATPSSRHSS
jgi:signal transduction histidine kinase